SRPFDLAVPPLLRVGLMKVIPGCCFLAVDMHHMVSDMMSLRLFKKELLRLYEGDAPEPLSLQYKDYACWRNSKQVNRTIKRQERYWLNMFSGDIPCADLPTDYERPQSRNFSGDSVSFEIGPKETAALKAMALEKKTSLFVVMLAAYNILLSKITDGEDIVVGIPVVGRGQPGLEKIIGMFVNTLALRNVPQADKTFGDFLSEVRQGSLDAFKNQDYLFDDLVSKVVKERDNSRNPLFDVFFAFANPDFPIAAQQDLLENDATEAAEITGTTNTTNTTNSTNSTETRKTTGLEEKFKNRSGGSGLSMFDLFLHGTETTTGSPGDSKNNAVLRLAITYSTVLFKEDTIKRFSGYFKDIVATAAGDVNIKLRDITLSHELGTAGAAALEEMDDNFGF
ncbi:MAG: hypothetical protein GY757_27530, partial [bacterium]|nr:hypothetical protein [bacterium]